MDSSVRRNEDLLLALPSGDILLLVRIKHNFQRRIQHQIQKILTLVQRLFIEVNDGRRTQMAVLSKMALLSGSCEKRN